MRRPDEAKLTDVPEIHWLLGPASLREMTGEASPNLSPEVQSIGIDRGQGALLAVQPELMPWHYRSQEEFAAPLAVLLEQAGEAGFLNRKTVVVFPELIGLGLYLADEFPWVARSKTLKEAAMWAMADEKIFILATALLKSWDRPYDQALFGELMRLKAGRAAEIYQDVFSRLAEQFGVAIVAGSIPLPRPSVQAGRLVPGREHPLDANQNVSALFHPGGAIHPQLAVKRHPTGMEAGRLFIKPQPEAPLLLADVPAGRLAVHVCADTWYPDVWQDTQGADLVAVPAYHPGRRQWGKAWEGYDHVEDLPGLPEPAGETQAEAWMKHALPGRIAASGAKAGVVSFLRGSLYELGSSGEVLAWAYGVPARLLQTRPAQLVQVWL